MLKTLSQTTCLALLIGSATAYSENSLICFPESIRPLEVEEAFTNQDIYSLDSSSCFGNIHAKPSPENTAIRAVTTRKSQPIVTLHGYKWRIHHPNIQRHKNKKDIIITGRIDHISRLKLKSRIEYKFVYNGEDTEVKQQNIRIIEGTSDQNPISYLENGSTSRRVAWMVDLGLQTIGLSNAFLNRGVIEDIGKTLIKDNEEDTVLTWQEHAPSLARGLSDRAYLWLRYRLEKAKNFKQTSYQYR